MTFIDNDPNRFHDARYSRVYLSNSLVTAGNWTEVDGLWCDELIDRVAPGMSEAKLRWNVGFFEWWYGERDVEHEPREDLRSYVKIEILKPPEDDDATPDVFPEPEVLYTWFGTIEADEFTDLLAGNDPPNTDQMITAYGLMRDLENTIVESAVVVNAAKDDVQRIPRGLTFNPVSIADLPGIGNQYKATLDVDAGLSWAFQRVRWDGTESEKPDRWDAYTAVDHLLTHQAPKQSGDTTAKTCTWKFAGLDDVLGPNHPLNTIAWYDISNVATDRRNLKEIIDELIPRRHFVGWYVYGDDTGGEFTAYVKVFSYSDKDIPLSDRNQKIAENTDQVRLDLLDKSEVDDLELVNNGTQRYDKVVAEGEYITTTFSFWHSEADFLINGWNEEDETTYLDAASNETGYGDLEESAKQQKNASIRADDKYRNVFSRFVMGTGFHDTRKTGDGFYDAGNYYDIVTTDEGLSVLNSDNVAAVMGSTAYGEAEWWSEGSRFLQTLPQPDDAVDEQAPELVTPFCLFRVSEAETPSIEEDIWQYAEQLNADQQRTFSVQLQTLRDDLGIRLIVGLAGGQQLIAKDDWSGAAVSPTSLDPTEATVNGLHYDDFICTAAVEWDDRIKHAEALTPLTNQTAANKVKFIRVDDARLDIRLPETIIGLNADGTLKQDENGTLIRDDRPRLKAIAKAAAAWYSTWRQAMNLVVNKITLSLRPNNSDGSRNETPLSLGTLITKVGVQISKPDVNSPITMIRFDMLQQKTQIQTTYYEGEFV